MPRGRHYYDPIVQAPGRVEPPQDLSRIELYPEQDVRDNVPPGSLRWVGRLIGPDGLIKEVAPGDFNHDGALRQAQELWPGLEVFELREESDDSTSEGFGLSPRMWQGAPPIAGNVTPALKAVPDDAVMADPNPPATLHAITVTGTYVRLEDLLALMEEYAAQFDAENNPSAALGIRQAAEALREPF